MSCNPGTGTTRMSRQRNRGDTRGRRRRQTAFSSSTQCSASFRSGTQVSQELKVFNCFYILLIFSEPDKRHTKLPDQIYRNAGQRNFNFNKDPIVGHGNDLCVLRPGDQPLLRVQQKGIQQCLKNRLMLSFSQFHPWLPIISGGVAETKAMEDLRKKKKKEEKQEKKKNNDKRYKN